MKSIVVFLISLLLAGITYAQEKGFECVSCESNEIDFEKFASGIGTGNVAIGYRAFVGGERSFALGDFSFAFGHGARASGMSSLAFGIESLAEGESSFAFGQGAKAQSKSSFAFGENTIAGGNYSYVLGRNSSAGGGAVAIGYYNNAFVEFSYLFGKYLKSMSSNSMILGVGTPQYLQNGVANSLMVGFNSNVPTLFVGSSSGNGTTGSIAVGNMTSPLAKLHICGDNDPANTEDASLYIQSANDSYFSTLWLGDKLHSIKSRPESPLTFITDEGTTFSFENGNIAMQSGYYVQTEKVFNPSTNKLQLFDNVNGITVANGGKVGIGMGGPISEPQAELHLLTIGGASGPNIRTEYSGGMPGAPFFCWDIENNQTEFAISYGTGSINPPTMTKKMIISDEGNVGIGNISPGYKLDVSGDIKFSGNLYDANGLFQQTQWNNNGTTIYYSDGNVGIGTNDPGEYMLAVAGNILAEEVMVQHPDKWYDFVFDDEYALIPLSELSNFIKENKHLPDVPAEAEVMQDGLNLGELNGILLKKVEELTLYLIDQQQEIEQLKQQVYNLSNN